MRISIDDYYLNIARSVSKRSTCIKRQYGAVIVNNKEIIATGYNGSPRGEINCNEVGHCPRINVPHNSGQYDNCCSVHAEQNAMISASRAEMIGGTLYLAGFEGEYGKTFELVDPKPCPICMRMLKNAGIVKIINNRGVIVI